MLRAERFDAAADAVDGTVDFDERVDEWLAAFLRGGNGQIVTVGRHEFGSPTEDFDTLFGRQPLWRLRNSV